MNKIYLTIIALLIIFSSCSNEEPNEKKEIEITEVTEKNSSEKTSIEEKEASINEEKQGEVDCERYWKTRFPSDSLRQLYLNEILRNSKLTENNKIFIEQLKEERESSLIIEKPVFPIYRFSDDELGIITGPIPAFINDKYVDLAKETNLFERFSETREKAMTEEYYGKLVLNPMILDEHYLSKEKPTFYCYTKSKDGGITRIKDLGIHVEDCLEYYEYTFEIENINEGDEFLFGSPYPIDLIYENNPNIDSLVAQSEEKACLDCPNSSHLAKTFARLKGTENVYFLFADTFPFNNELDTPSRSIIYIKENKEIVYLWYKEVDFFGCSCL